MAMSVSKLLEILEISPEPGVLSKSKGVFTYRRGFFYTHGVTPSKVQESLETRLTAANLKFTMIENGEIWKPFRGGDPLAKSSHWFVKFTIED